MPKELLFCCLFLTGFLISSSSAQLSPSFCLNGNQILVGVPFHLMDTGDSPTAAEAETNLNCSFSTRNSMQTIAEDKWTRDASGYTFFATGNYTYNCGKSRTGNLTVVSALYTISLCKDCPSERSQFYVTIGDSVQWVIPDSEVAQVDCVMSLRSEDGTELMMFPTNVTKHQFQEAGRFVLICKDDASINATIVVRSRSNTTTREEVASNRFGPLLYTHVTIMAVTFGVLFPIAVFLQYHKISLAYKIILPITIGLAVCGFIMVVAYVQLAGRKHFGFLIHGVVGLVLLILTVLGMPLLLLHKKTRIYHFRVGHIVAFFGMAQVLLGLGILRVPMPVALSLCAVYGLILVVIVSFYIFYPAKNTGSLNLKDAQKNGSVEMASRNGSLGSCNKESYSSLQNATGRGPQPLKQNIISEDRMVQLRKKSLDFAEAQRQMKQLNEELGLKHQLARELEEEEEERLKDIMDEKKERKDSKPDQDLASSEDSHAAFNLSSPDLDEDPFPSIDRKLYKKDSSSEDEYDKKEEDIDDHALYKESLLNRIQNSPRGINRARTFNHHGGSGDKGRDSDNDSERGGSLRITRHSKRAKVKLDHIFNQPDLAEVSQEPPSFNITPSTPPVHHKMMEYSVPDDSSTTALLSNTSFDSSQGITPSVTEQRNIPPVNAGRRQRKAAVIPPILTAPILEGEGPPGCPFHQSNLVVGGKSPSPRPCRRGISPTGVSSGEDGTSPKPRKKKVSVAQIEATVVPPTPVSLQPPSHLSRSSSFSTLRDHRDAFADNAFRSVMQISQDAIVCANSVGDIVFWSVGACKMFGYTPGEAIGSSLEMIIPQSFKEKHRKGINDRTERTMKYIRKHQYTPEEHKHARLYAVRGMTKGGHELPVEVNVTSFVLDGEMFYTGVISEMSKSGTGSRRDSFSSTSDLNEIALKQRALAVGAQMKMAHNFRSAEHISQRELERVLKGSLGTSFEVDSYQMEQMISGIMKAGDPEETGVISFVKLIQLLSKHQLYISESGLIVRYGKTKGNESSANQNRRQLVKEKMLQFLYSNAVSLIWILFYVILNLILVAVGVGVHSRDASYTSQWTMWAYGTGPVLSMNCVLLLLPMLSSLIHAMRNSSWMNNVFPLKNSILFHIIISMGLLFWVVIHLLTHLVSFGLDKERNPDYGRAIIKHLMPTITGIIVLIIFITMGVSSIKPLRKLLRFIPFNITHWIGSGVFYILLLVHGINYWNPSFWKWLLPAVIIFALERIYRHIIIRTEKINIKSAGRYDSVSRTAIVEFDRPKYFEFEPGQYILLNIPKIGYFERQPCQISSSPKDEKLTIHIPFSNDVWFKKAFEYLKQNPHNMPQPGQQNNRGGRERKNAKPTDEQTTDDPANRFPASFSGPYGPTCDSKFIFKYKISTVVCGDDGPHAAKAIIKKFLDYRKAVTCHCGCQPVLSKLYFVWVIPTGNDFEWFTDYLSDLCEDEHLHRYLDIRVFLTNIDSAPDELASALLQLGLKTAGDKVTVRRPSQPQLNNLYHMTSYGLPDFNSLLDYIASHHSSLWVDKPVAEFGVFTVGELKHTMNKDLLTAVKKTSKPGQLHFKQHKIIL